MVQSNCGTISVVKFWTTSIVLHTLTQAVKLLLESVTQTTVHITALETSAAWPLVIVYLPSHLMGKLIPHLPFLTCVSHTAHVIAIGWTSVCLSVIRWYCVKTAQPIVQLSLLPGSPMILVF